MRYQFALLLALISAPALGATAVPANGIITVSGEYYLSANRSSSATTNIQVTANNVDLNLSGKTVQCAPAAPATAVTFGVKVDGGNVTVRNGKVTGCYMGAHAGNSPGNVTFERIDFTGNTYIGANGGTTFIGNTFDDIGGYQGSAYAIGINGPASGCRIFGNVFRNFHRQTGVSPSLVGEGVGALLSASSTSCTVEANWFSNDQLEAVPDIGVWASSGVNLLNNNFTNFGRALAVVAGPLSVLDNRFWMRDPQAGSYAIGAQQGTAAGNVIIGYDDPLLGAITDGGNTILP